MRKKMIAAALLFFLGSGAAYADVTMNFGQGPEAYTLSLAGKTECEVTGSVMVPLRRTAEFLGFRVTVEEDGILVDDGNLSTKVVIGRDSYVVSAANPEITVQSAPISFGIAPSEENGVTYVPLSLFRVLLGNDPDTVKVEGHRIIFFPQEEEISAAPAPSPETKPELVGLANPFKEYVTPEGMQEGAGFSMTLPKIKKWNAVYRAIPGDLCEVIYRDGETEFLRIRKGKAADVSGDYRTYELTKVLNVRGKDVTMKGDKKRMHLATWQEDGFSYAVLSDEGVSLGKMKGYVKAVK